MNGNFFAILRLAGDEALIAWRNGKTCHLGDRAEEVDEIGDVIGSHIQNWPAANLVIEGGVRVPAFMAGAHESGRSADWLTKYAIVDQPACRLVAATEERIGSRTNSQALCFCRIRKALAFGEIDAQRFFGIGVFAGVQRPQTHFHMCLGDRQVDDDFHRGVRKKRVYACCRKAKFCGAGFRHLLVHIRETANVENGKRRHGLEIGAGNIAAAYDADADLVHMIPPVN